MLFDIFKKKGSSREKESKTIPDKEKTIETVKQEEIELPKQVTCSGSLIYSEPGNPYETVEVYLDLKPHFTVKSYISEHGPDGGSSWRLIIMDEENHMKLEETLHKAGQTDLNSFLKSFWIDQQGMYSLQQYLDECGIKYKLGYYF